MCHSWQGGYYGVRLEQYISNILTCPITHFTDIYCVCHMSDPMGSTKCQAIKKGFIYWREDTHRVLCSYQWAPIGTGLGCPCFLREECTISCSAVSFLDQGCLSHCSLTFFWSGVSHGTWSPQMQLGLLANNSRNLCLCPTRPGVTDIWRHTWLFNVGTENLNAGPCAMQQAF